MRTGCFSLVASAATAVLFSSIALLPVHQAVTEEVRPAPPSCTCPTPPQAPRASPRPKYAAHDPDDGDEIAALEAVSAALNEVADGASYVWDRGNGRLSGMVQPTSSFKDTAGRVCRHLVIMLSTETRAARVEGVACRLADGRWQLEG
jgi:17 kDa outer membrane surface antigen